MTDTSRTTSLASSTAAIVAGGNTSVEHAQSEIGHTDIIPLAAGVTQTLHFDMNTIMSSSQISNASSIDLASTIQQKPNLSISHNQHLAACRFPKLEECAHFHYERVQLGSVSVRLCDEKTESQSIGGASSLSQQPQSQTQPQTQLQQQSSSSVLSVDQHNNIMQCNRSITASTQAATGTTTGAGAGASSSTGIAHNYWFLIRVTAGRSEPFLVRRSVDNLKMFDEMLHRCVYDRKISCLTDLGEFEAFNEDQLETMLTGYFVRFSEIASDSMTCGPILTWLQIDNKGRRLPVVDSDTMRSINTPAVGAAYGVRRYQAQACDEISIEVGDMISVIDMPSPAESVWWRGKKSHLQKSHYEVGFFPQSCVATIGDKVPRNMPLPAPLVGSLAVSPTKPVLRKHGKLIAFFRSFILSRPSRRRLKQTGIYKERVFSCDLSEHLLNSGQDIPMVLKCCAEFIEEYGIVDGIYRLSGITSNIQKLRRSFDEERVPDLSHPDIKQDIHAVSSLLKMYFRELPNPLCTYQLYDHFVDAIQCRTDNDERLRQMKETVQKLPPPHYRTLKYLASHLYTISLLASRTGMTDRNLAIVWAPNLLRSPALESGGVAALRGVGVQAVVTEYLISNCSLIFDSMDDDMHQRLSTGGQYDSLTDNESYIVESRDHEHIFSIERPKSLSVGGTKLISLEEAQSRHNRLDSVDSYKSIPINTPPIQTGCSTYIEVGGGPSSLPDKYHTVLPVPRSWQKRKTHSWKSLFSRAPRQSNSNHDIKGTGFNGTNTLGPKPQIKDEQPIIGKDNDKENVNLTNTVQMVVPKAPKLIDVYDGAAKTAVVTMDICVRSNSIDSLRTAGHSRSVSHDSYFDLLQSPLRGVVTCPSRELSELGINFDREEPEMRIFSESESLVSSPKVAKETSRRVLRARPDEFVTAANSVNPSPKKQPRLNMQTVNEVVDTANDESLCKRYKLEDQLSDIQFIDCSTPEHNFNVACPSYANVQIHQPPAPPVTNASNATTGTVENEAKLDVAHEKTTFLESSKTKNNHLFSILKPYDPNTVARYSYPGTQESASIIEGRFSYPGLMNNKKLPTHGRAFDEPHRGGVFFNQGFEDNDQIRAQSDDTNSKVSDDTKKDPSKLSAVTPSTPELSPRYSLLIGETSSENSSLPNTPIFDMEMSGTSFDVRGDVSESANLLSAATASSCRLSSSYDNTKDDTHPFAVGSPQQQQQQQHGESVRINLRKLKNEMSLDLKGDTKMSVDQSMLDTINVPSTPITPNYTQTSGNTSQSMTPSEFGYQHLTHRQSSNVVSLESSPTTADVYEMLEQAFGKDHSDSTRLISVSPVNSSKTVAPIKATISITYKSPAKKSLNDANDNKTKINDDYEEVDISNCEKYCTKKSDTLLETSFDENMVYEQVKFYKSAISEVNEMLALDGPTAKATTVGKAKKSQIVPDLCLDASNIQNGETELKSNTAIIGTSPNKVAPVMSDSEDVLMPDQELLVDDSLEIDTNLSLYANVLVSKPKCIYENVIPAAVAVPNEEAEPDLDNSMEYKMETLQRIEAKPSGFLVRQLANKFETSPVDVLPALDFSKPYTKKAERTSPCATRAKNAKQLHKFSKITRSLDENAFVREFGRDPKLGDSPSKISVTGIPIKKIVEAEIVDGNQTIGRRKSLEFTRPKSLNPPKKLPTLIANAERTKDDGKLKLDIVRANATADIQITPTTENRISLIQQNIEQTTKSGGETDEKVAASLSYIKGLGSFKLDRDRIEKIKEERRHQLSEKFRSESFRSDKEFTRLKSISKGELGESKTVDKDDMIKYRSKSKGDVSTLRDELLGKKYEDDVLGVRVRKSSGDAKSKENICGSPQRGSFEVKLYDTKIRQKFEKRDTERERDAHSLNLPLTPSKTSQNTQRETFSPQFSIKDVAAIFESRSQNQ